MKQVYFTLLTVRMYVGVQERSPISWVHLCSFQLIIIIESHVIYLMASLTTYYIHVRAHKGIENTD